MSFLLLTVSQRRMRLLEGNRQRVEELELDEVPTDLRETIEAPEPRSDTMARSVSPTGRGGPAVFYGHGAADEHYKKDEVRRFLRQVAGGLREYLVTQDLPMVLVGLDQLVAAYREVNDYPHVTEEAVRQNPDQLSDEELHASAWPVIAAALTERRRQAVERFNELHGTGRATNNILEIGDASVNGRVETLFLAADPWCWEEPGTDSPTVVRLGADDRFAHCEQLDQAAVDTLSRRGQVYAVPEQVVPGGGDVAAVLRY